MTGIAPTQLPGRIVDIVHAAAQHRVHTYNLCLAGERPELDVYPRSDDQHTEYDAALRIFAQLGTAARIDDPGPHRTWVRVVGEVAGVTVRAVVDRPELPAVDPAGLIAEVDAARAAQAAADQSAEEDAAGGAR